MNREKNKKKFLFLSFGILIFVSISAYAEDIKSRMKSRQPDLAVLKMQGFIGENNKGFLEFISDKRIKEELINAENSDRLAVYKALAEKMSVSVGTVGKIRALQIAKIAQEGDWLQDADGNWYKKR